MRIMEKLKQHLKLSEGFRDKAYLCPEGALTIGYGFNLDARGLPQKVADYWLEHEMDVAAADLKYACGDLAFVKTINMDRTAVLVDMTYNMGISRLLGFTKMFKALDAEDYEKAADEMLRSRWAKQVKGRAVRLSEIMRTGVWP